MGIGIGAPFVNQHPEAGSGGTLVDANNGLSLDGTSTIAQLGQELGAAGDPAIFLGNREIPMAGFLFQFLSGGNRKFVIDNANERYQLGDIDSASTGLQLDINDGSDSLKIKSTLLDFIIIGPDTAGGTHPTSSYSVTSQVPPFDKVSWDMALNLATGAETAILQDTSNHRLIDSSMNQGAASNFINIGGVGGADNGNGIFINDSTETVRARINDRSGFLNKDALHWYLSIDPSGLYDFGDIGNTGNGMYLSIDDANEIATISKGANPFLSLDIPNGAYQIGDVNSVQNGMLIYIDAIGGSIDIGDVYGISNSTLLRILDGGSQIGISATNGLRIVGDANFLLHTGTSLTDYAAAAVGTLTNAPTAGNPTKWISIDDNGTTRVIPTWDPV